MSMKSLVTEECGGPNPLMRLAGKVRAGNIQQREIGIHQLENEDLQGQADYEELLSTVPQTFDMHCLLQEVNQIQAPAGIENGDLLSSKMARSWGTEYLSMKNGVMEEIGKENVSNSQQTLTRNFQQNLTPMQPLYGLPLLSRQPLLMPHQLGGQPILKPTETLKWAHEYLDEDKAVTNDQSQKSGQEIIEAFENEDAETSKENSIVTDVIKDPTYELAAEWVREYHDATASDDVLDLHREISKDLESDTAYWEKLRREWTELYSEQQFQNDQDFTLNGLEHEYKQGYNLEDDNPFEGVEGAFEKGIIKLNEGDLISAILLFEEAVRVKPDHAEAWQYLGTSQAENEQDTLAIRALNKCAELQPDNLTARMSLAVSYTNEYLQAQAYDALKSWIKFNPSYSHLVKEKSSNSDSNLGSSMMSRAMFEELETMYLTAARTSPQGNIDTDVQIGLGVLYNLSGDYQKAIDCFQAGLQANPDSATLWNKLGATFANSSRPAEAIAAYKNVLELRPGFIRCRYNIGISCVSMNAYTEAAEHFLSALSMQRQGEDPKRPASTMSESIWSTLRMTISMLGRLDLMRAVDQRDLDLLSNEFNSDKPST